MKSINPEAYIVGEIWDDASRWLAGDEFDAVMNYRFARAVVRFLIDTDGRRYSSSDFDKELADVRKSYANEVNYILQNLIDSHDTDRLSSMILNPNRTYDDQNSPRRNKGYRVEKPAGSGRAIQKLILLFQMSYVGAPMIYYGDEAGMWGADDPDDRKPMVWPDLEYEHERSHPVPGRARNFDEVTFDRELFDYYRKLIRVRNENIALRRGDYRTVQSSDDGLFVFQRVFEENNVIVVLNNSRQRRAVRLEAGGEYTDALSGDTVVGSDGLSIELPATSGKILLKK